MLWTCMAAAAERVHPSSIRPITTFQTHDFGERYTNLSRYLPPKPDGSLSTKVKLWGGPVIGPSVMRCSLSRLRSKGEPTWTISTNNLVKAPSGNQ